MTRPFLSLLLTLHLFATTALLPLGDLSAIEFIPQWYAQCKATEDHDMTFVDFITDHLINLDQVTDAHGDGDHQRPHLPFQLPLTLISFDLFTPTPAAETVAVQQPFRAAISASQYQYISAHLIFHPPLQRI